MSETCPVLTLSQLDGQMLETDSEQQLALRTKCGRPLPLVHLRVVDEQMVDAPHDGETTGEVVVRAPWLTPGYLKNPRASELLWRGGYLHTGDVGHLDPHGYLKVVDRLKDVIKTSGEWIPSIVIEDLVSQCPGVAELAAIGVRDDKWGERPLVLVVPAAGAELHGAAVKSHLQRCADAGAISKWAVSDRVLVVEALAKTSVGKLDKKRLRQAYATDRGQA